MFKYNINKENPVKTLSLFSGIGAFEKALTNLEIPHKVINYCEIDKFASTSYAAIHNVSEELNLVDVRKVNGEKIGEIDLMTWGFPCFVEGTLILTDKGYKKIEDITSMDRVLTHTNQYKQVVEPMRNYADKIYKFNSPVSEDLLVTEEHPFYVRKVDYKWDSKQKKNIKVFGEPEWKSIKELYLDNNYENYYGSVAINQESKLPIWNGTVKDVVRGKFIEKRYLNNLNTLFETKEFWYIVGRWFGDGWTTNHYAKKGKYKKHIERTIICCNNKNDKELNEILDRLNKLPFKFNVVKERTTYKIHITDVELTRFLYQFGQGAGNKRFTSSIFDLPKEYIKDLLDGYIDSDGYIDKKDCINISSISKELIYGVGMCVLKAYNIPYRIYKNERNKTHIIEGRLVNQNTSYLICFKKDSKNVKSVVMDNKLWFKINRIEEEKFDGFVYNMEVEDDNSYTANNIVVHNCTNLSRAGKQQGFYDENGDITSSGLYFEGLRILSEVKPKVSIIENVSALLSPKFKETFNMIIEDLDNQGYETFWEVMNAKNYNMPQQRDRVFIISIRKDISIDNFKFEEPNLTDLRLNSFLLEDKVSEKYYLSKTMIDGFYKGNIRMEEAGFGYRFKPYEVNELDKVIARCITTRAGGRRADNFIRYSDYRIRKLMPEECFLLMGFTEEDCNVARNSLIEKYYKGKDRADSQLFKQAGNSICVTVAESIFRSLYIK